MNLNKFLLSTLVFLSIGIQGEARNCKKGKPCGNSCISRNDVCHKETTTSTMAPETAAPVMETADTKKSAKNCTKGKACGDSCIDKDAVCHK